MKMKEINAEIYLNGNNDGIPSNSLTKKQRISLRYGKKPRIPFSKTWRKKTIGKSSTLG